MRVSVAIPIYKQMPSDDEMASLRQCVKILGNYDIFLVCPESLDIGIYEKETSQDFKCMRFPSFYFDGIEGYSQLMTSRIFYNQFSDYDYMLVYQLDAWVFKDELEKWCKKGYDYIGAPWFEHQNGKSWTEIERNADGSYRLWLTGNGGLSLRRVAAFKTITRRFQRAQTVKEVFFNEYGSLKDLGRCLLLCCGPWIGTNSMRHLIKSEAMRVGEDAFFCHTLAKTRFKLSVPSPEEAAFFAFECQPAYLFQYVTQGVLPFGCHAWRKYEYEEFWKGFISVSESCTK